VQAVTRALSILNCFSVECPELGVTEISRELDLPKSTVHRLLVTLQRRGFIDFNSENQKYRLGLKVFCLGAVCRSQMQLAKKSVPVMRDLRDQTGETVTLNIVENSDHMCVELMESTHDLRPFTSVGRRTPLHLGAAGKVLLAFMERRPLLEAVEDIARVSGQRNPEMESLKRELEDVRRQGYAYTAGEDVEGTCAVSAPVRDFSGEVVAALTLSGPAVRFPPPKVAAVIQMVKLAARRLSHDLGHVLPEPGEELLGPPRTG